MKFEPRHVDSFGEINPVVEYIDQNQNEERKEEMKEEVESLRDDFKPQHGSAFKSHVSFEKESS